MMDEGKIIIINLSKGRIGESNANLLGGMLITKIYLAALSRADVSDMVLKTLPNFYLFVDEFQSFANESFADILSEARKYKLNLTIAHQYIEQMEEEVRAAVFGNVGTMIIFRVGAYDAEVLEKEFAPQFTAEDIVNLGIFQIYLKLMIDGVSSQPFSATTLPPIPKPEISNAQRVIEMSRQQFATSRANIEKYLEDWHAPMKPPQKNVDKPMSAPVPRPQLQHQIQSQPQPQQQPQSPQVHTHTPTPTPAPVHHVPPAQNHAPLQHQAHHGAHKTHEKPHPISISTLAKKPKEPVKNTQKDIQPERTNELKNALAAIMNNHKNPEVKSEAKIEKRPEPVKERDNKEVSENVLRDVLKVD